MTNEDGATTGDTWSIEPATVTINTLTINGKEVTLDVSRQLKEAVLINNDGSLAGWPWGLVNYHQKRCDKLEEHAHLVWQLDDQLRQDTIQPPRWESYRSDTCDALVFAYGTVERLPSTTMRSGPPPEDPVRPRQSRPSRPWFSRKNHQDSAQAPPEPEQPARFRWHPPEFGQIRRRRVDDLIFDLIFLLDDIGCSVYLPWGPEQFGGPLPAKHSAANRDALLAQLKDEVAPEKEHRAKHEARWAEIQNLPQLFIAV